LHATEREKKRLVFIYSFIFSFRNIQRLRLHRKFYMQLIVKSTHRLPRILVYVIAIVLGVIVSIFGINMFSLNNTDSTVFKQVKTFPIKDYVSELRNYSFPTSIQRNLIITAAINTDLLSVYRFARSVRASCSFCTLVMIMNKVTMSNYDFQELADVYSIIYISEEDYFPAKLKKDRPDITFIYFTRWIIIKNFLSSLETQGSIFDNVFICDSHDSLFQKDIFTYMNNSNPGLYAFMEDVRMTIGTCPINSGWIQTCYGEKELKKLFNKSISCAGTVLGTWSATMLYLSAMESEIITTSASCKHTLGDQGLHNYIIHNNKIPNTTIHQISHEYGFVGTLGYAQWLKRNPFGLVLNANGSIYAVIHQWNRSKQMVTQFAREYQLIPANIRNKKQ